jgi:hypothetical protein
MNTIVTIVLWSILDSRKKKTKLYTKALSRVSFGIYIKSSGKRIERR